MHSAIHKIRQITELPLHPKLMNSSRMSFFWLANASVAKVAQSRVAAGEVSRQRQVAPVNNWTLAVVKGAVSDGEDVYSPRWSRKKNAITIMWATTKTATRFIASVSPSICRITVIGIGLTLWGGGSSILYAVHVLVKRKYILLNGFRRWLWPPILESIWLIARTAPSAGRA